MPYQGCLRHIHVYPTVPFIGSIVDLACTISTLGQQINIHVVGMTLDVYCCDLEDWNVWIMVIPSLSSIV